MMTSTGVFSDVIDPSVRALFSVASEDQASELYYGNFGLTDYEPDVPGEVLSDLSGPTKAGLAGEGQEYTVVTKVKGYPVTLKMRKYTSKLQYTEEDAHWLAKSASSKRLTEIKDAVSDAVLSLNQRINEDACKVFYLGFGSTFLTVGNSEALFGAHNIKVDGSSQKNTFPTGDTHRAFGATALTDAISIINRYKLHNGNQVLRAKGLKLIVATELAATAFQTIDSMYGPTTANLGLQTGSAAALKRRGMDIDVTVGYDIPYAYRNYWFLSVTERAAKRAFIAWAWKPRLNSENEYHNGSMYMTGSTLFGPVVKGWQWAFGSKGDASAS
jgi:hypothetical protein